MRADSWCTMPMKIEPIYIEIGRRIRNRRTQLGLTHDELAARMDHPLQRASICNIEGAKQRIPMHVLAEIAGVLDVSIEDVLPVEREPVPDHDVVIASIREEMIRKLNMPAEQVDTLMVKLGL